MLPQGDDFISKAELTNLLAFMGMESDEVRAPPDRCAHDCSRKSPEVLARRSGQSYLSGVWSAFDTDKNGLLDYEVRGRLARPAPVPPRTILPSATPND